MYIDVNTFSGIHLAQLTCTLFSFPSGGQAHKNVVRVTLHREVRVQTSAATARDRCESVKRALHPIKRDLYCHLSKELYIVISPIFFAGARAECRRVCVR